MQSENGGVYHKVTCANFPGYVMPEYETDQLIVRWFRLRQRRTSVRMAMAYEFYLDVDAAFAQEFCGGRAAWGYLEENTWFITCLSPPVTTATILTG